MIGMYKKKTEKSHNNAVVTAGLLAITGLLSILQQWWKCSSMRLDKITCNFSITKTYLFFLSTEKKLLLSTNFLVKLNTNIYSSGKKGGFILWHISMAVVFSSYMFRYFVFSNDSFFVRMNTWVWFGENAH